MKNSEPELLKIDLWDRIESLFNITRKTINQKIDNNNDYILKQADSVCTELKNSIRELIQPELNLTDE